MFNLIFLSRFSGLVRFVAVANTFENPFYILRFDRDYSAKLDGAEIDGEGVEEAFKMSVSPKSSLPPY